MSGDFLVGLSKVPARLNLGTVPSPLGYSFPMVNFATPFWVRMSFPRPPQEQRGSLSSWLWWGWVPIFVYPFWTGVNRQDRNLG